MRISTSDFSASTVEVKDLGYPIHGGYAGAFTDDTWGYMVPYNSDNPSQYKDGIALRFLLSDFGVTVETVDMFSTNSLIYGFIGGFTDGKHAYYLPSGDTANGYGNVSSLGFEPGHFEQT